MSSRNAKIYEIWKTIQDVIGEAKLWPLSIRKLFWTKNLCNWDRCLLAAFAYVNGLGPNLLLDWIDLYGLCRDSSARQHIIYLLNKFEEGKYTYLYSYNIAQNQYQYIDGRIKLYIPKSKRR